MTSLIVIIKTMLSQENIQEIIIRISEKFSPKNIWLFGSYANGNPTEDSDIDILIVDDKNRDKRQLNVDIQSEFFPRNYAMDLLIVDPKELEFKKKHFFFWKKIIEEGKEVYVR